MYFITKTRIFLFNHLSKIYPAFLRKVYKMDIGEGTLISRKARLDRSINPKGIHIGEDTLITYGAIVLSHDASRGIKVDTIIGNRCFIGIFSIIMPGIKIGNEVIVGAGSVVTKDVPDNCIVAGNPAKIIRTNIHCNKFGRLAE